jgi:hypothetical protein
MMVRSTTPLPTEHDRREPTLDAAIQRVAGPALVVLVYTRKVVTNTYTYWDDAYKVLKNLKKLLTIVISLNSKRE